MQLHAQALALRCLDLHTCAVMPPPSPAPPCPLLPSPPPFPLLLQAFEHSMPQDLRRGLQGLDRLRSQMGVDMAGVHGAIIEHIEVDQVLFDAVDVVAGGAWGRWGGRAGGRERRGGLGWKGGAHACAMPLMARRCILVVLEFTAALCIPVILLSYMHTSTHQYTSTHASAHKCTHIPHAHAAPPLVRQPAV